MVMMVIRLKCGITVLVVATHNPFSRPENKETELVNAGSICSGENGEPCELSKTCASNEFS